MHHTPLTILPGSSTSDTPEPSTVPAFLVPDLACEPADNRADRWFCFARPCGAAFLAIKILMKTSDTSDLCRPGFRVGVSMEILSNDVSLSDALRNPFIEWFDASCAPGLQICDPLVRCSLFSLPRPMLVRSVALVIPVGVSLQFFSVVGSMKPVTTGHGIPG
eukprot:ANDGO_01595.mRNA.1 hypothetical protein